MHPKDFIDAIDEAKIAAAISKAEDATSGHIHVSVSHRPCVDALASARKQFFKLKMAENPLRNGVLIYFAPRSRTFAIWGDTGLHEKCGASFWHSAAEKISARLKARQLTQAIEEAVRDVGEALSLHFPRSR